MLKRILSSILTLSMALSMLCISHVSASAPLQFEGATSVLFDQSFGGIGSAAGAPDFTISGTWVYADHFMMSSLSSGSTSGYVQTKDSYDLSDASGFELEVKMECTHNGNTIHIPGGYTVQWNNNTKRLTLSKDGTELNGVALNTIYGSDTVYNVKYLDGKWTVNATSSTKNVTFTYDDDSKPVFKGKFKAQANSTGHFTMYYMKLTKYANTATVNYWKYDKKFSSADTIDALKEEGYTFSSADFTVTDSGIKSINHNRNVTFRPYGKDFSGSYYFETAIQRSQNRHWLSFNKSDKGYYSLEMPKADTDNNLYLKKYDAATKKTHTLVKQPFTNGTNGITTTYKVKVENLSDGSVKITVDALYGSTVIPTFTYHDTDTDTDIENADTGMPLTYGIFQADWSYCGDNSYLKYIKAYSLVTEADKAEQTPASYSKVYTNKTFTTSDTKELLTSEGYTLGSAATIADNGIVTNSSSVTYAQDMGNNYSYEADMYRLYNNSSIVFDKYDAKNYYTVEVNYSSASNKYIRIRKIAEGSEVAELTQSETSSFGNPSYPSVDYGYDRVSNYKINVSTENGTKTITLVYKSGTEGAEKTLTMIDDNPIDGSGITMTPGHTGRLVKFKAISKYADGEYPVEILNRTIGAADSAATLAADGLTSSSGNTYSASGAYLYNGTITYNNVLSGNYKLETKYKNSQNSSIVYFNYVDSNNWYKYEVSVKSSSNNHIKLVKKSNGTEYVLGTLSLNASPWGWTEMRTNAATVIIDLKVDDETGALNIDLIAKSGNGKIITETYVDSDTDTIDGADTGAPITSGYYKVNTPSGSKTYFSLMKVTQYPNNSKFYDGDIPVYVGRFSNDDGDLLGVTNGPIYFEYPVGRLGNYKVIATLHENNEMTGIKVMNPVELYAGKVKLFTVSDSENAKVRVYFFDGEETLNRIAEVYELN